MKTIITIILLFPFILLSQEEGIVHWLDDTINTEANWEGGMTSFYEENGALNIVLGKTKLYKNLTIDPLTGNSSEWVYDLSYPSKKIWFSEILEFEEKKHAIFNEIDKSNNKFTVYSLLLENECCGELKPIYEHEFVKNSPPLVKQSNTTVFTTVKKRDQEAEFKLSNDSTKLVFINQRSLNPKGKVDQIQVAVFNSDFNLNWEKAIDFPYRDVNFIIEEVAISNDGQHVVLLAGIPINGEYSYVLYHITPNDMSEVSLDLKEDCYPVAIFPMMNDDENTLSIKGLFENTNDRKTYVSGVFWGQKSMLNIESPPFQYVRFTEDEQKNIEGVTFHISDIHFFENGNVHLLFDSEFSLPIPFYRYPETGRYSYGLASSSSSFCKELISCTFNPAGELINTNIIERKFTRMFDGRGYSKIYYDNSVLLFYDSILSKERGEKLNVDISKIKFYLSTQLVQIDDIGEIVREDLLWSTINSPLSFEDIIAQRIGDKILVGGRILKNVQGPRFISGERNFRFGYIELKDLAR